MAMDMQWLQIVRVGWVAGFLGLLSGPIAQGQPATVTARSDANFVRVDQNQRMPILAVVNRQPITREHVAHQALLRHGNAVLQSMVNKLLVLSECKQRGIVITERDVNREIVRLAESFNLAADAYLQLIESKRNITEDRYKNDIVWMDLALRQLAARQIEISPEELNAQMELEFGAKVEVREIVVPQRETAERVREMLLANPDQFSNLAQQYSLNPHSAAVGGLLPPIARHSVHPELEQIVFALKPGEVSPIVELDANAFLLLRCERVFPAQDIPAKDLPKLHQKLIDKMAAAKLGDAATQLFKELQQRAQIENVLNDPKLRSQFPETAARVNGIEISMAFLAEECIARFGDEIIDGEINRLILSQAVQAAGLQITKEDLNNEVRRAAEAFGFYRPDGNVDIDAWLKYATGDDPSRIDLYMEDEVWPTTALKKLVESKVQITNDDLQKGFEANFGPRVEALVIALNDHRTANRVWHMATANPTREYFGELARQYSQEPGSQANYGQVPPIQRHGGRAELENEAFRLKVGEISRVVQVGEYYIILMCVGHTQPVVTEFEAVKDHLHADILEKKLRIAMHEEFNRLRDAAQIDNFLAGISQR